MNDSNRRLLLALAICLGIVFVWQMLFSPPAPNPPPAAKESTPAAPREPLAADARVTARPAADAAVDEPEGPPVTVESSRWRGLLSPRGAALESFVLKHPRYREERGEKGKTAPVELVQAGKPPFPFEVDFGPALTPTAPWRAEAVSQNVWRFVKEDARARLTKTFRFDPRSHVARLELRAENRGSVPAAQRIAVRVHGRQGPGGGPSMMNPNPRFWRPVCYANGKVHREEPGELTQEQRAFVGDVRWTGIDDPYFLMAVVVAGQEQDKESRRCVMRGEKVSGESGRFSATMELAERMVPPGGSLEQAFVLYLGPKVLGDLDAVLVDGKPAGLAEAVDFGWLEVLCRPMLWLLKLFQTWVGNWGVAIILLTLVVKFGTLYWTQKSMRSMRKMAKLGPEMKKLQEKYASDKDRLNKETWALYKREGVNPLGSCLPMLLQMPIWLALYRTLAGSVELYRSSFVWWIDDLARPDRYFVLPILLGLLSIVQARIQTTNPSDPQQKMMMWMMPVMFLFFSLFVPSGLTLYWLINTVLTLGHQWLMNRTDGGAAPKAPQLAGAKT
ncbi:MAG: membrane protein insertase YidC [Myxococcota bacterium]